MKLKEMLKKFNIFERKTTIFVSSKVYDEVRKIMETMGMKYKLKYAEPKYFGQEIIWWYEIDITCGRDAYQDFHRYLETADCRGDMGFVGYGISCK